MLTDEQKQYQKNIGLYQPKRHVIKNCFKAFIVGGSICALGQFISNVYITYFPMTQKEAMSPTIATLILVAALLTGFGVYDRLGQFAGAGSLVPVTGFSNAMTSAALEHRSEGLVFGIGANMFKLTGAVIAFGVLSAYLVSLTRLLIKMLIQ
ncbi:stage V sporulation protein AC [Halalkalibacter urbisdiaboli]|uniref:stage V sporulation protein AC n=1 Tax=Halalkalibacter urbisdiaboli TaxID=1960589 RepID=UPI000B43BAB0|nr:stage V sporulation protein AC [Halalkalibacter urbisdiaboli]